MRTEYSDHRSAPSNWAVINTHAHREQVAVQNLQRQEFCVYCPFVRRQRRHARRVTEVLRPLFPGYLFAQIDPADQRWRPMLSTIGVRSVVQCGDRLSLIENEFIQSLKVREENGAIARPENPYQIGQEIRIAGGAFDGLVATILDMDERDRITVLMDLLNRPVKVKIGERQISPV